MQRLRNRMEPNKYGGRSMNKDVIVGVIHSQFTNKGI